MFPPMIPVVAAVLEYLQGVDLSSMRFAYVGTFLGVPVALAFLYMVWREWGRAPSMRIAVPAVVGLFVAVAGAVVTHGTVYYDAPRGELIAQLTAPRVNGIYTRPQYATHVNDLVNEIQRQTGPGESIFVFPDGQAYYLITGRNNPTK